MRISCYLLLACPLVALSAPPKHLAPYAVADRYRPFLPGQQKLTGLLANRVQANIEGYLERVDSETLTGAFVAAEDSQSASEPQVGILIEAASTAFEISRDVRLKSDLDRITGDLLQSQNASGYLGAYANVQKWQAKDFVVHRGDLLGLLAYYRVTKSLPAFEAAENIGNSLVAALEPDAAKNSGAIYFLEPMAYLYRYTADPRFLDFCKALARPLATSAAIHAPPTEEGMAELLGFAELYRLTGDGSLLDAATTGWRELHDLHLSIAGTVVSDPHAYELGSQCTAAGWFQLTLELLRLTGNARYGDELERTIYNALLAAQDARTGNIAPSLSLAGPKAFTSGLANCLPCEALAISSLSAASWGRYGRGGIAIIQYSGGRAVVPMRRRETVQIFSEGSFPESGEILLHIDPSHSIHFPLLLRVPDWAGRFVVDAGDTHVFGKPGEFITLNRDWHRGDTVKISMDLAVRVLHGDDAHPDVLAIQRGPQLLALGKSLNPELKDLSVAGLASDTEEIKLTSADYRLPPNWPGDQAYSTPGKIGNRAETITLLPFADALSCSVWLRKPPTAHAGSS